MDARGRPKIAHWLRHSMRKLPLQNLFQFKSAPRIERQNRMLKSKKKPKSNKLVVEVKLGLPENQTNDVQAWLRENDTISMLVNGCLESPIHVLASEVDFYDGKKPSWIFLSYHIRHFPDMACILNKNADVMLLVVASDSDIGKSAKHGSIPLGNW